jgi:CRP-like cAMP-binding protein
MFLKYFQGREPEDFGPNQIIFKEGDTGDTAYVVHSGYVDLTIHGETLTTLQSSEMFGEMSLIDNQARFATATAGPKGVKLYHIDQPVFIETVRLDPKFALDIMRLMVERLRMWGKLFE